MGYTHDIRRAGIYNDEESSQIVEGLRCGSIGQATVDHSYLKN